jgi:membrane-associated phospholipid phosphatase
MAFINKSVALQRIKKLWYLKAAGNTAFVYIFFQLYFYLLHHPRQPVTVMSLTVLDGLLPYADLSLYIYFSLWVYTALPPALMPGFRRLCFYGMAISCLCLMGLGVFYWYPTAVPDAYKHALGRLYILSDVDGTGNAFPSLHVAAAVFTAYWCKAMLAELDAAVWLQVANVLWALAIVLSTLATRQHVVLDVVSGVALGALVAMLTLWVDKRLFGRLA